MFITSPRPLTFWERFTLRVETEFVATERRLRELLEPVEATVESAAPAIQRTEVARAEAFELLRRLEQLQMLLLALKTQAHVVQHEMGLALHQLRIEALSEITRVFEAHTGSRPRRVRAESDLKAAATRYDLLKMQGTGEAALSERQNLRAFRVQLPVLGQEDVRDYESAVRTLHANVDELEAQRHALRADAVYGLQILDELVPLLNELGVGASPVHAEESHATVSEPSGSQEHATL